MSKLLLVFVFALGFFLPALGSSHIAQKPYDGFTVWLDCQRHGAAAFFYELDKDEGHMDRASKSFKIDISVPQTCQPSSIESYVTDTVDPATGKWDRGHLVPANHMDNSLSAMTDTFFVTNVLPQNLKFNRSGGAWFQTEKISECYRDISPLSIWGGMIWGEDTGNDFFVTTHGVATADFWWKLIYRHDTKDFIAWIFPNDKTAKAKDMNKFVATIREIKTRAEFVPDLGELEQFPDYKTGKAWAVKGSRTLKCEGISTSGG